MQLLTYKYSRRDDLLEISQLETIQPNEIDPLEPTKCHRHGGIPAVGRENKPMRLTHHNSTFPAWHFLPSSTALSFVFSSSPSSFPQINFLTPMCSVISSFRFLYFPLYRYSTVGNASTPRKFLKIPGTTSRSCRQFFLDFPPNSTGRYIGLAFFPYNGNMSPWAVSAQREESEEPSADELSRSQPIAARQLFPSAYRLCLFPLFYFGVLCFFWVCRRRSVSYARAAPPVIAYVTIVLDSSAVKGLVYHHNLLSSPTAEYYGTRNPAFRAALASVITIIVGCASLASLGQSPRLKLPAFFFRLAIIPPINHSVPQAQLYHDHPSSINSILVSLQLLLYSFNPASTKKG